MKRLPKKITYGEKYTPAMAITDQAEADRYFALCVDHSMRMGKTRVEAEELERTNLGYFAGYYDVMTRRRVDKLYGAMHPIFGRSEPTAEEAFEIGKTIGRLMAGGSR